VILPFDIDKLQDENLRKLRRGGDRYDPTRVNPTQPTNTGTCAWQHVPENENE